MNNQFEKLKDMVDDSTTHVEIETPENWRCRRMDCKVDYLHKHGIFETIKII